MTQPPDNNPIGRNRRFTRLLIPAVDGLRMYPRTSTTLVLLVGGALAVALPIAWLTLWRNGHTETALQLQRLAPTGDDGPNYFPASRIEQVALLSFFRMLGAIGIATLALSLLAALGLSASRASQRSGETTIRRAVGAGRTILYGGLTVEGMILAAITVVVAIGAGATLGRLAFLGWPEGTGPGSVRIAIIAGLVVSGLLVIGTLLPVIYAKRHPLGEPSTRPVPLYLPAVQLGLSLIVLVAGGLLARHANRVLHPAHAAVHDGAVYAIAPVASSKSDLSSSYASLLQRIESPAGVSLASPGAIIGAGPTNRITTDCGSCMDGTVPARFKRVTVTQQVVSADSFHALSIEAVAGRIFNRADSVGAKQVVIVSQSLARDFFQGGQPIGRSLRIQEPRGVRSEADEWYEVVGVVEDRKSSALGGALQTVRAIYLSVLQQPPAVVELMLGSDARATGPQEVELALNKAFGVDGARVTRTTPAALMARESARMSWFGLRIGLLGIVMLLVATTGTAVLMRSWVISLRAELGLRRAVGATTRQLLRLVLGQALKVAIAGTFVGIWFGPPIWDSLGSTVRDIDTWNPGLIAALAATLFVATVGGVAFPAVRATRATAATLLGSAEE